MSSSSPNNENFNNLIKWAEKNNGFIHSSLRFSPRNPSSTSGSSVIAKVNIPADSELIKCPKSLAIDYAKASAGFPELFSRSVPAHVLLCFFLCKEWAKKDMSFWWPYLNTLPWEFDTPLYFEEDDMEFLDGCNMGVQDIESRRSAWREEWKYGAKLLSSLGENTEQYTWDLFLWASTIFTSRCFPEKMMGSEISPATSSVLLDSKSKNQSTPPALFPLIDSLNHLPLTKITWQPAINGFSIISGELVGEGQEVFNNYGPKSNEELLMGYGFALEDHPNDSVALRFNPPLSPTQASIRSRQSQPSRADVYNLFLNASPFLPKELTGLFHILTATVTELPLLEADPNANIVTVRNELATYVQLYFAIKMKLNGFKNDVGVPKNSKQCAANIYRNSQISILRKSLSNIESTLNVNFSHAYASGTLITLRSALGEPIFSKAIEKCFGTDEIEELEEANQEDIVFVLYICWKYLCSKEVKWRNWFDLVEKYYGTLVAVVNVEESVEETFAAIFPAAGEESPEIFGGERWTKELLGWVMKVFQNEGVVVLAGNGLNDSVYVISLEVKVV